MESPRSTSGLSICIHRSAKEIGGNCIEIRAAAGERLLLDVGLPLDAQEGESSMPQTLDTERPVAGVLLSHAHADHCGLLKELPDEWPVYCGKVTEILMRLSDGVGKKTIDQKCVNWENGKSIAIGLFKVTPRRIDHSVIDAYALQIDVEGRTIVYTGDFRAHGINAELTEDIMRNSPKRVDALIMEGTNLFAADSAPKPVLTEARLKEDFVRLFRKCQGRVFVSWSCANIDRAITLYEACKESGRVLVPDLYCTLVLERIKEFADNIPQPGGKGGHMRAVVTNKMKHLMNRLGESGLIEKLRQNLAAMGAARLSENPKKWVIMARGSLLEDFKSKGVEPNERDAWVWSMWKGYLERESTRSMREFFAPCRQEYIHSSGHASPDLLRKFAEVMKPGVLIPVHGENWDAWKEHFPNLRVVEDGEWLNLGALSAMNII